MSHVLTLDVIAACYCCISAKGAPAAFTLEYASLPGILFAERPVTLEGPCAVVCQESCVALMAFHSSQTVNVAC